MYDRSDRPRNIMVPCDDLCGLLTLIQNCFWRSIKKVVPSFVQGMTKQQIVDSFKDGVPNDWVSICIDGSGFDSTQNWKVM